MVVRGFYEIVANVTLPPHVATLEYDFVYVAVRVTKYLHRPTSRPNRATLRPMKYA